MATVTTVSGSFEAICSRWSQVHLQELNATIQYVLSDPLPGDIGALYVTFTNGVPAATAGTLENPEVTLKLSATDYIAMANDNFDVAKAFMTGAFKVEGNGLIARQMYFSYRNRDKPFITNAPPLTVPNSGNLQRIMEESAARLAAKKPL